MTPRFIALLPLVAIFGAIASAQPAPIPIYGLAGNSNYFFYSSGATINSLQATVEFDTDLIMDSQGVSFQLNSFSPKNHSIAFQQMCWLFDGKTVFGAVETWTANRLGDGLRDALLVINQAGVYANASAVIPAGSVLSMQLLFDEHNNVNGGFLHANIGGIQYNSTVPFANATVVSPAHPQPFAPIIAFTFDIVGDGNYKIANLKQGSGTITYESSTNHFFPVDRYPGELSPRGTGENGNSVYGVVDSDAVQSLTQTWGVKN
jgi:hypothetical protein